MRTLYFRCNSGHYFAEGACPFDGWEHPELDAVLEALDTVRARGPDISIDLLRQAGLSEETLQNLVLIEFGDPAAKFEAIAPEHVKANGVVYELHKLPGRLK